MDVFRLKTYGAHHLVGQFGVFFRVREVCIVAVFAVVITLNDDSNELSLLPGHLLKFGLVFSVLLRSGVGRVVKLEDCFLTDRSKRVLGPTIRSFESNHRHRVNDFAIVVQRCFPHESEVFLQERVFEVGIFVKRAGVRKENLVLFATGPLLARI